MFSSCRLVIEPWHDSINGKKFQKSGPFEITVVASCVKFRLFKVEVVTVSIQPLKVCCGKGTIRHRCLERIDPSSDKEKFYLV